MRQPHEIQLQILQKLLFSPRLKYTQMKPSSDLENNQFQFHLNKLMSQELIIKENGKYRLTNKGKEYANRIDDEKTKIRTQAKISAWVCITRKRGGQLQYLISTRLKHPFYGRQGFMSGKVRYGEKVIEAAKREIKEETNLSVNKVKVVAIVHFRVFDKKTKELLEDKYMHLCLAKSPVGEIVPNKEVKCDWVNENNLSTYLTNPFEKKAEFMKYIGLTKKHNNVIVFLEIDHYEDNF